MVGQFVLKCAISVVRNYLQMKYLLQIQLDKKKRFQGYVDKRFSLKGYQYDIENKTKYFF